MSPETKQLLRALFDLAALLIMLWLTLPGHPPLAPLAWRTGARVCQTISDHTQTLSLRCRTNYWKALRS